LTADRFRTENGQRWYRTDDLVTDGPHGIEFTGRADRQLKIRGNRVEPAEVEAALLALPGVHRAIVTGERPTGDAPMELVAYLVGTARPSEVTGLLHGSLPSAHVPSRMHVVPAIPVGGNGKVDLAALRAAAAVDIPAAVDGDLPRTDTERMIADIWCAVLGRERIGRDERFLEIGGDSFKLLGVFGRLRRHFPSLGIAMLFAHPTIAQLAAAVAEPDDRPVPVAAAPVVEL
jgi:aryl carrier-like protein